MAGYKATLNTVASEALDLLKLGNGPEEVTNYDVAGKSPKSLQNLSAGGDYLMLGITPKELSELYGGTQFDFEALKIEFAKICLDFNKDLGQTAKSKSLEFASLIAYKVGPETRTVKKPGTDKRWSFRFVDAEPTSSSAKSKISTKVVFVSTFKNVEAPKTAPIVENNQLILTIKQASLLSLFVLEKAVDICYKNGSSIIMTPLAGAIFAKSDIVEITKVSLGSEDVEPKDVVGVINSIIQSCQSGGQYLTHSKAHIAVVASICATKNMKDLALRKSIVTKTFKQYASRNKVFDFEKFQIFGQYATGGIPAEFAAERLISSYDELTSVNYRHSSMASRTKLQTHPKNASGNA